jgi:hypothetical protein
MGLGGRVPSKLETFLDPLEASLMVVEVLAHGRHVSVDQG